MSIIYEALKKTQQKRETTADIIVLKKEKSKFFPPKLNISINYKIIAGAVIGLIALVIIYSLLKPTPTKPVLEKPVLNGVFISDKEKMAMINNRMMHVGDVVSGMKITEIEYSGVSLNNGEARLAVH